MKGIEGKVKHDVAVAVAELYHDIDTDDAAAVVEQ